ncbi:MAG TPA: riboflavin synthase [Terriglobales bacterium]|nr:riboflavin synthase [Terriglobales bacterium]
MFTGIIQCVGRVAGFTHDGAGAHLSVTADAAVARGLKPGSSFAVNGCCLTLVRRAGRRLHADLSRETLDRTALGGYRSGDPVNLEPALRAGDELGGHMIQGHVEGTGRFLGLTPVEGAGGWRLEIEARAPLLKYMVPKGSLAVDGISLTIASLHGARVSFAIIPYTYEHTNLRHLEAGQAVNLETDPMARHLERLLEARMGSSELDLNELIRQGF